MIRACIGFGVMAHKVDERILCKDAFEELLIGEELLGPLTVILSQKILFESRKMGTLWEVEGKPNFRPVVYNMGGPLFVWGWFYFFLGTCGVPAMMNIASPYAGLPKAVLPLYFNWRTVLAFAGNNGR